ncbi:ankyrin repeat domain-containing protein 2B isoform X3 [Medicago truncatula]|uniref:ankyrin repeat domain-containing protein 2B isoform X3 n=1 Tax=Medicago truncatula TaxID=3880 RepID=UPI000D2F1DEB|nr:ankyrin repeat domain-containing protein 2B isoform X3 [Medicago truncatula]
MASISQKDFPADDQQRTKIPNKNCKRKNKKSKIKSFSTATRGRGTGFPINPFNFSSLLYDTNIKKLAEQAEKYPSFNQMAQQDGLLKSHKRKTFSIMRRIIFSDDLWTLAERLSDALVQDPSTSSMLEIYVKLSFEGKRKRGTAQVDRDPCLKLILDEIESGGPAVLMRYWNDERVLKMFGLVMGISLGPGDAVYSENFGSFVHHTAIIGNVKNLKELPSNRVSPQSSSKYKCKQTERTQETQEEHSLAVLMLKLNLVDLLFRRAPCNPLPYYWCGYVRTQSGGCSRVKSSASTHNLPDQETQLGAGKEGLLTILARVTSETPSARFAQEFVLVLFLYHCLCTMPCVQCDEVVKAVEAAVEAAKYRIIHNLYRESSEVE